MNAEMQQQSTSFQIGFDLFKINVMFYYSKMRLSTKNHFHSGFEIHFIGSGRGTFIIDFDSRHDVKAGDLIFVGKGVYHEEIVNNADKMSGFCIGIDIVEERAKADSQALRAIYSMAHTRFFIEHEQWETELLLEMLAQEINNQDYFVEESVKSLVSLIIIRIGRICTEDKSTKSTLKMKRTVEHMIIDGFFNRIFDYDMDDLTLQALAKKLSLSERHLNRLIHEMYGMSFIEKLNRTKLEFVRYELLNSKKTIEEISESCNWTSTYLIRQFKKQYKETPTVFRRINKD